MKRKIAKLVKAGVNRRIAELMIDPPDCLCEHPFSLHGDRAVSACLGSASYIGFPFTPRCPCPGYHTC